MERFISLLNYLERVNPDAGFTVRGKIPAHKTPLDYLNTFGTVGPIDFTVFFPKVSNILAIHEDWPEDNGIVFESVVWSGIIDRHESSIQIYLNPAIKSMYMKSHNESFSRMIEEFSHMYGYRIYSKM